MNKENDLKKISLLYSSDKVEHGYIDIYHDYFKEIKDEKLKILEIGIADGYSILTWSDYFKNSTIIGIGAVILNNAKIGKNCIVGAKSLITENKQIPDNSLVMGSPGKIIRQVTDEEIKATLKNAIRYQNNWKKYSQSIV